MRPVARLPVALGRMLELFSARDLQSMIASAFLVLGEAVDCDLASAFYRCGEAGLLKERDSRGRESSPALMARHAAINPAIPLALANPGVKVLTTRAALPALDAAVHQTAFYREIMLPQGWRHSVALCFWSEPPAALPMFVASVYRSEGKPDFSPREVEVLRGVHAFLDCAVRRVHEREAATTVRDGLALAVRSQSRAVAILDGQLTLVHANAAARLRCAGWQLEGAGHAVTRVGGEPDWMLPPALEGACLGLLREWQQLVRLAHEPLDNRPQRRVAHPDRRVGETTITMICPEVAGTSGPSFVLDFAATEGVASEAPPGPDTALVRMTAAERAVATVLAEGLSNQEIADRLGKTIHAVKFLLHRIYRRTGVPSRAALVALLRPDSGHSRRPRGVSGSLRRHGDASPPRAGSGQA